MIDPKRDQYIPSRSLKLRHPDFVSIRMGAIELVLVGNSGSSHGSHSLRSKDPMSCPTQAWIAPLSSRASATLEPGVVLGYPVSPYVEERNGGLYVAGTGVSLDSVVIRFQEGASPDKIVQSFPALKLSQVYGVIAYYLENEQTIDDYIAEGERELERSAAPLSRTNPELFARRQMASKRV